MHTNKIKVKQARFIPSWMTWAGYGFMVGSAVAFDATGLNGIMYVTVGYGLVLTYVASLLYNQFALYYNQIQIKELTQKLDSEELIEQLNGTYQDSIGLKEDQDE